MVWGSDFGCRAFGLMLACRDWEIGRGLVGQQVLRFASIFRTSTYLHPAPHPPYSVWSNGPMAKRIAKDLGRRPSPQKSAAFKNSQSQLPSPNSTAKLISLFLIRVLICRGLKNQHCLKQIIALVAYRHDMGCRT